MRLKSVALALVLVCSVPAIAQNDKQQHMTPAQKAEMDAMMKYMTPGEGHKALDGMVGTFDTRVTMFQPGAPPQTSTGTTVNQWILGNRFVEQRFTGTFMGMPFEGIGHTGYDNAKKKYVGTWIDNFSTGVMTSIGSTSDNGKTWTFKSEMTDPKTGKDMPGESRLTITDTDHHTMEMWGAGPNGKNMKMMQIEYTRRK
ncbi:MAG: hypothetical protein NVSMB68_13420 [Thermoanaerobaculia bacterium]